MPKPATKTQPVVTFIDNPHAPELFCTEAVGFLVSEGNIHITFATTRVNHATNPGGMNRVVIARVVLPVAGAQGLAAGLYDFLKKRGLDPVGKPVDSQLQ